MPAARDMLVGSERASGALPPTVVTLMMRPPPRRFMCGMTSRQRRIAPMTFKSKSYCQVASSTCSKPEAEEVPALFTRMSTPPNCATVAATNASISAPCVTSVAIVTAGRAPDGVRRPLEHVLAPGTHGDLRAGAREPLHAGAAEPLAAAGDDGNLAGETELQSVHDRLQIRDCPNISLRGRLV